MNLSSSFLEHFETLEDPRLDNHNLRHELTDILVITILGTICGADGWTEIYESIRNQLDSYAMLALVEWIRNN